MLDVHFFCFWLFVGPDFVRVVILFRGAEAHAQTELQWELGL